MKYLRHNEPHDPELRRLSKVLPDRWIDEQWPQRSSAHQGQWQRLASSQLVRVHLLTLVKRLDSFNRVCRELGHNVDWRRFCRLSPGQAAPTAKMLSVFRERIQIHGCLQIQRTLLQAVGQLQPPPALGVVLADATDLPAAIRRSSKKKHDGSGTAAPAGRRG